MSKNKNSSYQKSLDGLIEAVNSRSVLIDEGCSLYQYTYLAFLEAIAYAVLSVADATEDKEKEIFCPKCLHKVR